MSEVFDVRLFRLPAAMLAAAMLLAWIPAAQADSSFSFSFHGGYGYDRGYFHGKKHRHYNGYRGGYEYKRHYFVYPGKGVYRHYGGPYWRPRHYQGPEPRCIYRHGYRYCR